SGTTAYVTSAGDNSLTIIDVSDPSSPVLLAELKDGVGGFDQLDGPVDVAVSGTTAYVVSFRDSSLTIIDVSDPANPVLLAELIDGVGGFDQLRAASGVAVSGTIAYILSQFDNSLTVIDVSNPASPVLLAELIDGVGGINELGGATKVVVTGTTAYIVSYIDSSLTIIDVSNPVAPVLLSELKDGVGGFNELDTAAGLAISGTTAYVTSAGDNSLTIIDVSDPSSPVLLAELKDGAGGFEQLRGANGVAISGKIAYVTSQIDSSLTIIDVQDPANPVKLAELKDSVGEFNALAGAKGVVVSGTTAYVASQSDYSLTIIDVTAPGYPALTVEGRVGIDGTVTASTFSGSGAGLTNLNGANVSAGTITSAALASGASDDADADPTNELVTQFALNGSNLELTDAGGLRSVDLSGFEETWSTLAGIPAGFSDGTDDVNDADADPTNELQALTLGSNTLSLTNGGSVNLASYLDNTDAQALSLAGNTLSLANGGSVNLDSVGPWTVSGAHLNRVSGNVGIGTATPTKKLHISNGDSGQPISSSADIVIEDDLDVTIALNSGATRASTITFAKNGASDSGRITYDGTNKMSFRTNDVDDRLVIGSSGNVGIGISSPQAKLDVAGTVRATAFAGSGALLTGLDAGSLTG
ncbi:MAG: hypothetical protein KDM91_17535, partial [Verrucomicrobiae bacterium]|nr:hypothetical protein [Verrucomicrobiae bacterium]